MFHQRMFLHVATGLLNKWEWVPNPNSRIFLGELRCNEMDSLLHIQSHATVRLMGIVLVFFCSTAQTHTKTLKGYVAQRSGDRRISKSFCVSQLGLPVQKKLWREVAAFQAFEKYFAGLLFISLVSTEIGTHIDAVCLFGKKTKIRGTEQWRRGDWGAIWMLHRNLVCIIEGPAHSFSRSSRGPSEDATLGDVENRADWIAPASSILRQFRRWSGCDMQKHPLVLRKNQSE